MKEGCLLSAPYIRNENTRESNYYRSSTSWCEYPAGIFDVRPAGVDGNRFGCDVCVTGGLAFDVVKATPAWRGEFKAVIWGCGG